MTYEKEKRKNDDAPSMFWTLLQSLWHYTIVLPLQGTWWLTQQSVRGAWWLTKQSAKLGWAATVWTVNMPLRVLTWLWQLIMGLPPEFETQREKNIYRLFRRRYRRRNFFMAHTLLYSLGLFVSGVAMMSIFRYSSRYDPFQAISSTAAFAITWTIIWAFHLMHKRSGDSEDKELREALGYESSHQQRKPKQRVYEQAYYDERLAEDYEPNDNHSAEYYEDEDGYTSARQR